MAGETLLVIEDEEDIIELIEYNMKKDGFAVTSVMSGEEGLKLARERQPNLVLLDLMLPGMDGLEVCRRLKADRNTRHLPIVMLTAKSEDADIVAGL